MQEIEQNNEQTGSFGANSWFVEEIYNSYRDNPEDLPEQWKAYFGNMLNSTNGKGTQPANGIGQTGKPVKYPQPLPGDDVRPLTGAAGKIIDNMDSSLTVPTATSQRTVPVKLLEENRLLANAHLAKLGKKKISFTHIIGWAILQAIKKYPVMNYSFSVREGKPFVSKRSTINLGIAIDVERKDGTRNLMVPNIKNAEQLNFKQYLEHYEALVSQSRKGSIDPSAFAGTTISLTNPGTIGTIGSIPRLMVGQGAIIATGAIQYPAEYQAMSQSTISKLGISKVLTLTSTYDHRIIQGAESGMFLKEIHELLLGSNGFYEQLFKDLGVPIRPMAWETDIHPGFAEGTGNFEEITKHGKVRQLINMYRVRGHLLASIDPLRPNTSYHPELDPSHYQLTLWDLDRPYLTHDFGNKKTDSLRNILAILQKTYCDHIGVEYMHIQNPEEKEWLQNQMEPFQNTAHFDDETKKRLLYKLIQAEGLEHFIHTKFVGHKRFSLEGLETFIPLLDYILNEAADSGAEEAVLGMAHRGRLNVLTNIIGKSYESLFSEFEDIFDADSYAGSGDVKYHLGAYGVYETLNKKKIGVSIASNPSHLEWVNPVVEGMVRAKQTRAKDSENEKFLPILLHGDAAFAGQGVVSETLNLSQLKGYRTGGTIHIITNNQIGFTTGPEEARSSQYATDVAKMVQAPIFHVNADDPEATLWVGKIAFAYRNTFKKDIVIDVVGYRRHGHNEGDEPGFTQPVLYDIIKSHPSTLVIYSQKLINEGVISEEEFKSLRDGFNGSLDSALATVAARAQQLKSEVPVAVQIYDPALPLHEVETAVTPEHLNDLVIRLTTVPDEYNINPKIQKLLDKRREFILDPHGKADWSLGEGLAFASLVAEGIPVRLSGQDCVRGTFSQRHIAVTDVYTQEEYFPVNHMFNQQESVEALDSLLSEAAVMGFEYGYSTADPNSLVLWEAQFGDFANGAQIIIDNFIVASYEKWRTPNNLVLMLPHGFEGQGPEHSSARLERFLILCAQDSMEVCYPTTPAQIFHLLRRQMKKGYLRPLVIMTPKSLLRLPDARSKREEFLTGGFKQIIDDAAVRDAHKVERLVVTSGKVYYDLNKYRNEHALENVAIVRVEQFYPFNYPEFEAIVKKYPNVKKNVWVQEEPKNMGAWNFLQCRVFPDVFGGFKAVYVGRPESASPAVGSHKVAARQQETLVREAFEI